MLMMPWIKSAYRRLALRWYPDKNQNNRGLAEMKFREIGEAFSLLSDNKNKRKIYDWQGHTDLKRGASVWSLHAGIDFADFNFQDAEDIFRHFLVVEIHSKKSLLFFNLFIKYLLFPKKELEIW